MRKDSSCLTDHISLGVLTRLIRRDLVDEVVAECGKREKRSRLLPAHVVVYYVLALNLFFGDSYEEVMRRLVGGLQFLKNWAKEWHVPTTGAVSQARARLGEGPLKLLYERIAVPTDSHGVAGAWLAGFRLMAIDGVVLDVPDTPANDASFTRTGHADGQAAFPQVRVVGLGECGTHAIIGAAIASVGTGEQPLAEGLIDQLESDMLLLADRGFYSYSLFQQAIQTHAQLLWRVNSNVILPVVEVLDDGSYLSVVIDTKSRLRMRYLNDEKIRDLIEQVGTTVRVVEYEVDNRGLGDGSTYRLITTILDPDIAAAAELAAAYHQRWEFELALDEIEIHQTGHLRVLRSKSPEMVRQEIWSLLLTHYAIRDLMIQAADTSEEDLSRISFMRSIRAIRRQVNGLAAFSPHTT